MLPHARARFVIHSVVYKGITGITYVAVSIGEFLKRCRVSILRGFGWMLRMFIHEV